MNEAACGGRWLWHYMIWRLNVVRSLGRVKETRLWVSDFPSWNVHARTLLHEFARRSHELNVDSV